MQTILELEHVSKIFPGVVALDDISIEFKKGEIHALVGENGAGKSTMIKTLTGYHAPSKGIIRYEGKEYRNFTPTKAKEVGIGVIYQELNMVGHLSVAENIFLSDLPKKGSLLDRKEMEARTQEILDEMELPFSPKTRVNDLTIGYQQMVELAKALVVDAKLIIFDEPTAPLSSKEVEILFKEIARLKEKGITLIYISHRLEEIFRITDRVSVLRDGKMITTLNTKDTSKEELIQYMVGRSMNEVYPQRPKFCGKEVLLDTKSLTGNGVKDISLQIRKGEVLGLGGLVGAGRTEFAQLLFGAAKVESGEIVFKGKERKIQNPGDAMKLGIAMVPEDRKRQGLVLDESVSENISITVLKSISSAIFKILNKKKEADLTDKYKEKMKIKIYSGAQLAKQLSGGNQQKVVLAKELETNPELIIIDEPTRGIDVGAKQEIYKLMNELVADGMTILMITSEMEELLGMSDRIIVFCEGHKTGELTKEEFDSEKVLALASKY
ncbi:MAG: sugar ABC transporter ATP-binding protein [Eubacteriales bacterium]|nr:sugar ABC transporter ATP-binding protein [Eubacteriales bacterium]